MKVTEPKIEELYEFYSKWDKKSIEEKIEDIAIKVNVLIRLLNKNDTET